MPTYTYTCTACNDVIEKRQSFSDPPLTTCEQCGGSLRKIIHPVGIVFKGSGWYITDSRSSNSSTTASSRSKDEAATSSSSKDSKDASSSSKDSKESSSSSKDSKESSGSAASTSSS